MQDATFLTVYPQGLGNLNANAAEERAHNGYARSTSVPSWHGGGCAESPGPQGETCEQAKTGNLDMYGAVDLHYEGCSDSSYCNCCSCADDIGFVRTILSWVNRNFCVDRRRIYATGCSYGGMMAYQLGLSMPDVVAAIAPAFGGLLKGYGSVSDSTTGWVPVLVREH
eukprot:SAG31_NODE_3823_length_3849_cov_2.562133_3_plen_168_part_00